MLSIERQIVPKVCIIDSKAEAFYTQVRHIIRLITHVQHFANNDPDVADLLKVFFLAHCNFSLAEVIIQANDLSEHAGTLTMKFLMNGGLII